MKSNLLGLKNCKKLTQPREKKSIADSNHEMSLRALTVEIVTHPRYQPTGIAKVECVTPPRKDFCLCSAHLSRKSDRVSESTSIRSDPPRYRTGAIARITHAPRRREGGGILDRTGGKYKNLAISKTLEGRKEGEGMEERGEIGVSGAHFATRSPPN